MSLWTQTQHNCFPFCRATSIMSHKLSVVTTAKFLLFPTQHMLTLLLMLHFNFAVVGDNCHFSFAVFGNNLHFTFAVVGDN